MTVHIENPHIIILSLGLLAVILVGLFVGIKALFKCVRLPW